MYVHASTTQNLCYMNACSLFYFTKINNFVNDSLLYLFSVRGD